MTGLVLTQTSEASLKETLNRPLIVGASVSAGQGASSPGRKLALRYTDESRIRTVAFGGKPGVEVLKQVSDPVLRDRSVVIALDLFFWDSALPSPAASLAALDRLIRRTSEAGIPVVLGEIPELLPGRQPSRVRLNREIHALCVERKGCHVLPLAVMLERALRDGFVEIRGRKYALHELVPDGLHLAPVASLHLADEIEKTLRKAGATVN